MNLLNHKSPLTGQRITTMRQHIADKFSLVITETADTSNRLLEERTHHFDVHWAFNGSIISGLVFMGYVDMCMPQWDNAKRLIAKLKDKGIGFYTHVLHTELTMREGIEGLSITGNLSEATCLIPLMAGDGEEAASWEALEIYPLRLQKHLVHFNEWVRNYDGGDL